MTEQDVLSASLQGSPVTRQSLVTDLKRLGLTGGTTVLVHTSVSKLGWVAGGAQAVIEALQEVLGPDATLMMPAHSMHLTDPQHWRNPPVPESWWPVIRERNPVFDKQLTPTRIMGVVAELFRNLPDVQRSDHPHGSFAARGPQAEYLLEGHELTDMFGEASPLARLYDLDGYVLLLGVDHGNNTSLHLAENRATLPDKQYLEQGARMHRGGSETWVSFQDFAVNADDFAELGNCFATDTGQEARGDAGWGTARLMRQQQVVDYAVTWLEKNRGNPRGS